MMNASLFEKGKIVFQLFVIFSFQWASTTCQLNLYDTYQRFESNSLHFDCLNYHVYREKLAYQELSDVVDEIIPYCFRPKDNLDELLEGSSDLLSQKLSFEQMRVANFTSQQLLSWSVPIEVAEQYQFYLNKLHSSLNEHFYNCTLPRFGLRCQYSFESGEGISFDQIVEADLFGRIAYSESPNMLVQIPCYVLLKCHRNGRPWCLDWREVCDGKTDCFDEGLDEESCFDLEINECNEDEYRCHNGMCISQELWEDGLGDTECLDRSDSVLKIDYSNSCFQDPTFRCEEHSCRTSVDSFSCGDGQCVLKFKECHNGRHVLLIDSMAAKGSLTDECWVAMICLTKLVTKTNESSCKMWLMNNSIVYAALEQCNPIFQFPTIPVYSDHISFFYINVHLKSNVDEFLLPDYVCFDQQLCDFVVPDVVVENLTCLNQSKLELIWDIAIKSWIQVLSMIEAYFGSCLIPDAIYYNKTKDSEYPSLYNCRNSLKLISKHRIMDGTMDCFEDDDENYQNSCLLNDRYRVKCYDANKCWSSLVKNDACILNGFDEPEEIPFQSFCDGIDIYFYDSKRQKHRDESGCGNWSCNNIYARCDGFWACSDGRDEDNCGQTICPSETYACLSPVNYTVICLPSRFVKDRIVHCLGALDEQLGCRSAYPSKEISFRFRCANYDQCLRLPQVCDQEIHCPEGDDETFCNNQPFTCAQDSSHNRNEVEQVLCSLDEIESQQIKYFSVHTSPNYPSLKQSVVTEFTHWPTEWRPIRNGNVSRTENNLWPWYCNRGLIVHTWFKNNSSNRACMCPPSYYGHLCQYQNQRISLTLRLASDERHATYAVVSMLIDDNDERQEIDAYNQFVYIAKQSCSIKLNRYLLFSARPKNISKNYSVRIDIFEKNAMTYVGSWLFPISFLFLPVNRLGISLNLSNHQLSRSVNCSNTCNNGECVKYVNKDQFFCHCSPKWSGIQCNIPINCETCSPSSICIHSVKNRSICVCPINQFGPQCLLTSNCSINACQNNGQCIPADVSIPGNKYTCLCPNRFFGQNCEYEKAQVDVSLNAISIPSYLVAYFFTLSNKSEPIETTILRKLTLFQDTVIFHITIPYQLVFIQADDKYYLAVLQQSPKTHITTSISSAQECIPVEQLLNSTILKMIPYQRIIHFHLLCQTHMKLTCFIDQAYLCLCTNDHHANCMKFNRQRNFHCPSNDYCVNEGKCLQDHPTCPSIKICLCRSCFFGNRCQFYAKGLGSTLDEILGYEFKRHTLLSKQSITVKLAAAITTLVFLVGLINSILSIVAFSRSKSQEAGCGVYLLASSITSLCIMILFKLKFWFLFYSHQDLFDQHDQRRIIRGNCFGIEPTLKVLLYASNWLSVCVAIERTVSAYQGVTFNNKRSRRVAFWVTLLLFAIIIALLVPQLRRLHIYHDETEERSWCVVEYTPWLQIYSPTIIFFHYCAPLSINILSIILLIITTTRHRVLLQPNHSFWFHLRSRLKQHKHILISSTLIIVLTLPYLIISIILDCNKSSHLLWFYLIGYFLSFLPPALLFLIFVLPSTLYKQEFYKLIAHLRRRFDVFKINRFGV